MRTCSSPTGRPSSSSSRAGLRQRVLSTLSQSLGHPYWYVLGEGEGPGDIRVPIDELEQVLAAALGELRLPPEPGAPSLAGEAPTPRPDRPSRLIATFDRRRARSRPRGGRRPREAQPRCTETLRDGKCASAFARVDRLQVQRREERSRVDVLAELGDEAVPVDAEHVLVDQTESSQHTLLAHSACVGERFPAPRSARFRRQSESRASPRESRRCARSARRPEQPAGSSGGS